MKAPASGLSNKVKLFTRLKIKDYDTKKSKANCSVNR